MITCIDFRVTDDDPELLHEYFRERKMEKPVFYLQQYIEELAEDAREAFKRRRVKIHVAKDKTTELTLIEKYDRQLDKNRGSTAAWKVNKEVHSKRTAFTQRHASEQITVLQLKVMASGYW